MDLHWKCGLPPRDQEEVWRRWTAAQSIAEIARALGRNTGSIHAFLSAHGGIAPRPRKRSIRALTLSEREEISRGAAAGATVRAIALILGRDPSTVSRELQRNGGRKSYRAMGADSRALEKARRPKPRKLERMPHLEARVREKLRLSWAPEQISGWLREAFAEDKSMRVSPETIYRSLFFQARGKLKTELVSHLRSGRVMRRAKRSTTAGQLRGQIVGAISIRERPAEVEDRALPGHWEGDLVSGSKNTHIATLVERQTRFVKLVKVDGKDAASVAAALIREVQDLPKQLRRSLTWDRGSEMAHHRTFTVATDVQVYFCDPHSPWQRGSNENTNGLLRQFFPKGTDLSRYSQSDLNEVALLLNERPRKTLGFKTPAEKLASLVALTG